MWRCGSTRRSSGFTLLELLLVIAIIALLISILLPVLKQVRRRASVLACPIAYVGKDGWVHLTDLKGSSDVPVIRAFQREVDPNYYCTSLAWSPSGQKLATYIEPGPGQPWYYAIVDPASDQTWKHGVEDGGWGMPILFTGWVDSQTFCQFTKTKVYLRDAQAGKTLKELPKNMPDGVYGPAYFNLNALPPTARGTALAVANLTTSREPDGLAGIYLVRGKSLPGKPIWLEVNEVSNWPPRVDSMGEWIGWTQTLVYSAPTWVAIKRLGDPSSVPPTLLGREFNECNFCDWTEDGNILVAIFDAKYRGLAVMDKTGRVLQRIPVPIARIAVPASYRKYWHR